MAHEISKKSFTNLNFSRKKSSGISLIQLIIVVGIIAILLIGIYSVYTKKIDDAKAVQTDDLILNLKDRVINFYNNQSDYTGLSMASMNSANMLPDNMENVSGSANTNDAFGGSITLAPASTGASAQLDLAQITITQIPDDVCTKIVTDIGPRINVEP